jgi:BirA family transcriptional regulator, biotin operon repressor / biotin---[acetyl-CoA-carboxylase] ligase
MAISPRFAIKIFDGRVDGSVRPSGWWNERRILRSMPGPAATWSAPFREWHDDRLTDTRFGPVHWFASIDSTNRYVLAEAVRGAGEGLVAVADEQVAGRGRLGRSWVAPPGASLLVSVLLRPDLPADQWHVVTLAAAVAAVDAVRECCRVEALVKWPNDVTVDDRKLAGILSEVSTGALVVGMGLNVQWQAFPPELADTATACNMHSERVVARGDLLAEWLRALETRLGVIDDVVGATKARSATLGRRVRVDLAGNVVEGVAVDLTAEGFLVVRRDDGSETVVTAGDVVHLRPI